MRIQEIWIRFYKSFNFDYELKAKPGAREQPWQETEGIWMPHVRIPIEPDITAVVGANESGKSHLLDAIKIVLTGDGLLQRDFCRSSSFFSVERDSRRYPEVGATFGLDEADVTRLQELGIPRLKNGALLMLRPQPGRIAVVDSENQRVPLTEEGQVEGLQELLPYPQELQTNVPLPDSVSISALARSESAITSRKQRVKLLSSLVDLSTAEEIKSQATNLFTIMAANEENSKTQQEAQQLGMDLLTKVVRIEESSFEELEKAIAEEREGLVNGLIQKMNDSIARHLNVSRWWSQDSEFQLRVSPREHELVFTIRDRTGTDYSFTERSRGLTYFLSYYVQLLSHDRPDTRPEVLLMDEPDAYLSASGQQDLLRVLENHARPEDSDRESQVIYVTHSPFLINRNAGHRVRVVDKGSRDEGTRMVKDATRNHYEPLRTSLGEFVAETAFIGGDNLFVEGIADQVLLAGMNTRLLNSGTPPSQCLDLNQVTIVQAGSSIPYMLYLARGRDQVKPACAVLLDGDDAGETARKHIKRGGAHKKQIVDDELVVVVSEWAGEAELNVTEGVVVREPEDLVPVKVAVAACQRYAKTFLGLGEEETKKLKEKAVTQRLSKEDGSLWDSLKKAFDEAFDSDLNKAGFAKELLAYLEEAGGGPRSAGVPDLEKNFATLIHRLADTLREARDRESENRRDQRLERIIDTFRADYPSGCTRDRANVTLASIDRAVDNTTAGDIVQSGTARLRRDFKLTTEPLKNVEEYQAFLESLEKLQYLERLDQQGRIDSKAGKATKR
jgi:predicted ATP-dependent endonuclease of OLD family